MKSLKMSALIETSSVAEWGPGSTPVPTHLVPTQVVSNVDGLFIGLLVCAAIGAVLLVAGFIRLGIWAYKIKRDRTLRKKRRKQLQNMRYLEEYAIRSGGSPNEYMAKPNGTAQLIVPQNGPTTVFNWEDYGVNPAFISDDTLKRHSPRITLDAHMNGFAPKRRSSRPRSSCSSVVGISPQISVTSQEHENHRGLSPQLSVTSHELSNNNNGLDDTNKSVITVDTETTSVSMTTDSETVSSANGILPPAADVNF